MTTGNTILHDKEEKLGEGGNLSRRLFEQLRGNI
jgi:hypothetical protein